MSTTDATDLDGGSRDMRHVHAGARRWRKQQHRLRTRELKTQLADARRRETALWRAYSKAFDRAVRIPERRGPAAMTAAWDEADRAMNRVLASRKTIRDLEAKLRGVTS